MVCQEKGALCNNFPRFEAVEIGNHFVGAALGSTAENALTTKAIALDAQKVLTPNHSFQRTAFGSR
jgi:hypothetical protein